MSISQLLKSEVPIKLTRLTKFMDSTPAAVLEAFIADLCEFPEGNNDDAEVHAEDWLRQALSPILDDKAVSASIVWRATHAKPEMATSGYVRVWQGKVYGWCADPFNDPATEPVGALAVDVYGRIWRAYAGDTANGATAWEEIKRPCPGRSVGP